MLFTSWELYIFFNQFTQYLGPKKTVYFYCGPWLEGELVSKPHKSSVMFGYSWCVTSVVGSQVFGQALMESCVGQYNQNS